MKINSSKVAELAGVSRSTVSRVINNYSNVPEETKEKIMKVIKELGYIPNTNAQVLAGKTNKTIGLFVYGDNSEKRNILDSGLTFGYYLDLINRVLKESLKLEHQLLVDVVNDDSYSKIDSLFINRNIVGAIFIGFKGEDEKLEKLIQKGYLSVLVDYTLNPKVEAENIFYINTEDYEGAKLATDHLIELGKKNIIHISGNTEKLSSKERERGYLEAMNSAQLKPLIYNGNYNQLLAYDEINRILEEKVEFDAVFSANDNMSYGVLKALKEKNIIDIPIVGFDNLRNTIPLGIMSIAPDINKLAKEAVQSLIFQEKEKEKMKFIKTKLIKDLNEYLKESYLEECSL
ncbi:LacI family DNA-binding transcriptional regulator [Cetobacterium sp. 8H]|uniref:LacI family DNA-binding transcriptional regulator n=1 Tax=Cetobacterium sp. 8H TaxID=2759681 RepID=UPI00163D28CE|nr:LacI family DNA-binding transcriptional regulator [Cetobacterium sp. 8H]MBC2851955.1 LacI family DNA-binding transcriptional regulator [Cetobacterium sp. 8H]